jgi:membrane protease YdiL (CAAX protease family)
MLSGVATVVPTGGSPAYAEPLAGATYPLVLRGDSYLWWRSLGGVLLAPMIWLLLGGVVSTAVLGVAWSAAHRDLEKNAFIEAAGQFRHWEGMLSAHLQIALLIPICVLMVRYVHGVRPGFLWSVEGRPRWRFLAASIGVAMAVFALYIAALPLWGEPLRWQPQEGLWAFVVVIVLVGPLQAAAEEVFFRGYLLQGLGSLVASPWFGVVTSALVFALFHGTQNPALFVSRFAFGVVVGWLVLRTGGLEAAIAAHVINNAFAFLLAGLTSTIAEARTTTAVGWMQSFSGVLTYAIFTVLAVGLAVLMRVRRVVPAADRSAAQRGL